MSKKRLRDTDWLNATRWRTGAQFTVVVFPDKLTAYADYLQDDQWRATSVIPKLTRVRSFARLDLAFQQTLAEGLVDLYPRGQHALEQPRKPNRRADVPRFHSAGRRR